MFTGLREAARRQVHNDNGEVVQSLPSNCDLRRISLEELIDEVDPTSDHDVKQNLETLLIAEACLRDPSNIARANGDQKTLRRISEWASKVILPPPSILPEAEYDELEVQDKEKDGTELRYFQSASYIGIKLIQDLNGFYPLEQLENHASIITSLAVFTDEQDPWTTKRSTDRALFVLSIHDRLSKSPSVLVDHILRKTLKPLFASSKNPAITPQGRKAIAPLPTKLDTAVLEKDSKPWKYEKRYMITVFRWVLSNLDGALVEDNWPVIIPPLLTLIDDHSPSIKAKGCELLTLLLKITPSALLARTGLGDVLQDAVMPCLLYLPSLTPQDRSIELLTQAYPALMMLGRVTYPTTTDQRRKMRFLDAVLRKGIFGGYAHCGENVYIAQLLVNQIAIFVDEMGLWFVKHLKYAIPLLSDVLAATFGTAYPLLLLAAARTLHAIITNTWPRIAAYKAEILRGLAFCWCRISDEEELTEDLKAVKLALKSSCSLLRAATKAEVDVDQDFDILAQSNENLKALVDTQ